MCGDIVCCAAKCANDYGFKDSYQRPLTGGCSIHAAFCGNGTCAFILLKECQLLVCMKEEEVACTRRCIWMNTGRKIVV